jgi:hypothetical protein
VGSGGRAGTYEGLKGAVLSHGFVNIVEIGGGSAGVVVEVDLVTVGPLVGVAIQARRMGLWGGLGA